MTQLKRMDEMKTFAKEMERGVLGEWGSAPQWFYDLLGGPNELFGNFGRSVHKSETASPPEDLLRPICDVKETDTHYLVVAGLPGVAFEDLDISFHDNVLTLKGHRGEELYFSRKVRFAVHVSSEDAEASFENGLLLIAIPKIEEIEKVTRVPIRENRGLFFADLISEAEKYEHEAEQDEDRILSVRS